MNEWALDTFTEENNFFSGTICKIYVYVIYFFVSDRNLVFSDMTLFIPVVQTLIAFTSLIIAILLDPIRVGQAIDHIFFVFCSISSML